MEKTIVVFAPHPDDETLACGGTIILNTKQGNDVYVIYMTDGRHSHSHTFGITADPTPDELKVIRSSEAKRATNILGVKERNLIFLEYEDLSLTARNIESAAVRVEKLLKQLNPDMIYCPIIQDRHQDHKATNLILYKSMKLFNVLPEIYHYLIWGDLNYLIPGKSILVDITEVLPIKSKALKEYLSQTTKISSNQSRPVLENDFMKRFLKNTEEFYIGCQ